MGSNINLKLLHTFLLVAELSSFCRAAEELNRCQSAVSMQIRQLELQIGAVLFHRSTRRVHLTREGELLLVFARRAIAELQTGLHQIKEAVDVQCGRVSLACYPIASPRLPLILASFQKAYPGVTTQVRELVGADLFDSVRRQEVDFGIALRSPEAAELHFQPILSDEICALIPVGIDPNPRCSISLAALSALPLLVLSVSPAARCMLNSVQKSCRVTLNVKYEVQQIQTLLLMVSAGLGAAVLPRMAISSTLDPAVRIVPIVDPSLTCDMGLVTLRGQSLSPAAKRLAELVQRLIGGDCAADPALHLPIAATEVGRRRSRVEFPLSPIAS